MKEKHVAPILGLMLLATLAYALLASPADAQQRDAFQSLGSVNGCELYSAPRGCYVLMCGGGAAALSCR